MRIQSPIIIALAGVSLAILSQAPAGEPASPRQGKAPPSVDEARARAETLHEMLHATLHVMHDDFYEEDEGMPIPAASLEKVFRHIEGRQDVQLRWLVVDGEAMNVDNRPRDDFERAAVASIQTGKGPHERVEGDLYRRAAAITLTSECLKCHIPDRKSTEDRSAGLIVSMRIRKAP